jgi:hypothetical protein
MIRAAFCIQSGSLKSGSLKIVVFISDYQTPDFQTIY